MTVSPQDLINFQHALSDITGVARANIGIMGNAAHIAEGVSYHLGKDQLKLSLNPYSYRLARDKAGATNSASALDLDGNWGHGGTSAWYRYNDLVVQALRANDPALLTLRGINYTTSNGVVHRIDRENGFKTESSNDDGHTHHEWYRDTEGKRTGCLTRLQAIAQAAVDGITSYAQLGGDAFMALTDAQQNAIYYTLVTGIPDPTGATTGRVALHAWAGWVTATLNVLTANIDLDPAELAKVQAAAKAGIDAASVDIVQAVIAALPAGDTLTKADVEDALKTVLKSGVDN